jgi:hypothetical protein
MKALKHLLSVAVVITFSFILFLASPALAGSQKKSYWGDTHLHTSYSPDAFLLKNRSADPDTAYRYAKGEPVVHPYHRAKIQINTPLDFLVVADHGEFMGVIPALLKGDPVVGGTPTGKKYIKLFEEGKATEVFADLISQVNRGEPSEDLVNPEVSLSIWEEIMDAAERHNDPGKFTTFLGWEWSSTPKGANLHRVVFMREGKEIGKQFIPFTALDSDKPGKPISRAYAESRMRWETVVETTQIKGDSETHPMLSPTDEFADYETYDHYIQAGENEEVRLFGDAFLGEISEADRKYLEEHEERAAKAGDYTRSALMRGIAIESRIGVNPYKFGMIGSTDSHTGMASAEEDNFWGKMAMDSTPENTLDPQKLIVPPKTYGMDMGAAGLAAVWAEENTREAIFDAFHRKEVYATTGPRIQVRFFGGWKFKAKDAKASDLADIGYKKGVTMGSDLTDAPKGKAPTFLISALKDPNEANLDRIQIIKGWVDEEGKPQEKIYNVAMSDGRKVGRYGKVKPVGNTVDIKTANYTNSIGDTELATVWTDPDFDPKASAFYYVRVLQIPTPRHSLYDAVALNRPHPREYPATIQERAYTSPIWYTP